MHVWDVATSKLAVPLMRELVEPHHSTICVGIAGDRVVVTGENRYSVLDLSALLRKPTIDLPTLLTRAELATNQKLQLGELIPLEQQEWAQRWEQLVLTWRTQ